MFLFKRLTHLVAVVAVAGAVATARAQTYDVDALGVPKFVNTNYIALNKITAISKYRSNTGHDYSDSRQFGTQGYRDPVTGRIEACSSMKHYFMSPDDTVAIYAPVSGEITVAVDEPIGGTQIEIKSDAQPAFRVIMFHVALDAPLRVGDRVAEGQVLGHHTGSQTWSDIAVWVRTPRGSHLVSYFETLTETAFAAFRARGIETADQMIVPKSFREANPVFSCLGRATLEESPVTLTGGAVTQTISVTGLRNFATLTVGDLPTAFVATATSGLPVSAISQQPKVCAIAGATIVARRPGRCIVRFSQSGNTDTHAAADQEFSFTVVVPNTLVASRVRIGGIFPPAATGPQSYIRLTNRGSTAGTVAATVFDGDSGAVVLNWTSPPIAPAATRQFSIADITGAPAPGVARPSVYGIRVEPATTMGGTIQHVLFDAAVGGLTNASSCNTGVEGNPDIVPFVYSSAMPDYPSTLIFVSPATRALGVRAQLRLADSGVEAGTVYSPPITNNLPAPANTAIALGVASLETQVGFTPQPAQTSYNAVQVPGFQFLDGYLHHVVMNRRANVLSDMTTVCALLGADQTITTPLQTSGLHSGANVTAQSYLRFFNDGATSGPAVVVLRDPANGAALGRWTSPAIAPGSFRQIAVGAIEDEVGLARKDIYVATVETDIDGYFQHVLWRAPDGALANFSTCAGSVTTTPDLLIGVHASRVGAAGYPSTILINNTGTVSARATLDLIDARDGARLGTYTSPPIPADGQLKLDVSTAERDSGMVIDPAVSHYTVRLRGDFTGFLQHQIRNQAAGVVTDLSTVCAM